MIYEHRDTASVFPQAHKGICPPGTAICPTLLLPAPPCPTPMPPFLEACVSDEKAAPSCRYPINTNTTTSSRFYTSDSVGLPSESLWSLLCKYGIMVITPPPNSQGCCAGLNETISVTHLEYRGLALNKLPTPSPPYPVHSCTGILSSAMFLPHLGHNTGGSRFLKRNGLNRTG